jgi:hypothetical protein
VLGKRDNQLNEYISDYQRLHIALPHLFNDHYYTYVLPHLHIITRPINHIRMKLYCMLCYYNTMQCNDAIDYHNIYGRHSQY